MTATKRIASFSGVWKGFNQDGVQAFYKQSTLFIRANGWEVNVTRHPIYDRLVGAHNWRFDIAMRPLEGEWFTRKYGVPSKTCYPHGIIAQSWDGDNIPIDGATDDYTYNAEHPYVTTKAQAQGSIEGDAPGYKLRSAFDVQSRFTRFAFTAKDVCHPRNVSALAGVKRYTAASQPNNVGGSHEDDQHGDPSV